MFAPLMLLAVATVAADAEFDRFRESFRIDAVAAGIEPAVYDREMASAAPLKIVFERNDNQPEFVRPIWVYLDSAVSDTRVANGRKNYADHGEALERIAEAYGVDASVIAAIWGLESAYGRILGDTDIVSALSTLAYKGRRQSFGRRELIAALTILQKNYATREELQGSWAGAMGQTQFIPSTYLAYAVDYDEDGRRDLWKDLEDVFASTANYLSRSGFVPGQPAVLEVTLPDGFDYGEADGRERSVTDWIGAGLRGATRALPDAIDLNSPATLLLPAGAQGPAFLTFQNFKVIKRYNNATSYALGVALLSERIKGSDTPLKASWPRKDRPLSKTERISLQQELAERGFEPGPADGIIGPRTRGALRAWQQAQGMPADGYPSAQVLALLLES